MGTAILIVIAAIFYFIPTYMAVAKGGIGYALGMFLANLLLGWTGIGYICCFLWADFGNDPEVEDSWI